MKKKLFLAMVLVSAAAMLFAGGNQGSSGATLTVWDFKYGEETTGKVFRELDKLFIEKHPGVTINHVGQPETNYYQLLASAFTAKNAVDVVMIHPDNRAWNLVDFFEVLDSRITAEKANYSSAALKACSASQDPNRDIRMLPLTAQGMGVYYNKANFIKAGLDPNKVPSSWNDLLAACEALKKAGIPPYIMGTPHGICFTYRVILATLYGDRIEGFRNGTANFTDPEFRQATLAIKELFDKGYINVEAGSISYFTEAIDTFKAGKGGFFTGLCSDIGHWKDFGESLGYANVGYFSSPIITGARYPDAQINQGAGIGWAAVNYGKNKDLAVEYIKHYTSGQGGKMFMDASGAIVPNSTIPVDSSNQLLGTILKKMNSNPVNDFMNIIPGGMVDDFYNYQYLYFISKEISIDDYIKQVQQLYKNLL
ncbi:MAG: extracellular solute-binding protein [Treponema sp.]|jgi:ABC-type glycerol-3-phosphate transport system substrate-binding protein|nr:extracellular solute-binding protein [Treponema sp.]